MEAVTILNNPYDIYWEKTQLNFKDLNNKLFCTFVTEDVLDDMVNSISGAYSIMYNKMFVLFVKSTKFTIHIAHVRIIHIASDHKSRLWRRMPA